MEHLSVIGVLCHNLQLLSYSVRPSLKNTLVYYSKEKKFIASDPAN